jgi:predicted nucleic acid-binding protein
VLLTDTNILQRCSQGKAMARVIALRERGVKLATTDRNVEELHRNLIGALGYSEAEADAEVVRVLAPFDIVYSPDFEDLRPVADARLREGGKSDWPLLAAALAMEEQIWSDDTDFFGVGVPVWTSHNTQYFVENTE